MIRAGTDRQAGFALVESIAVLALSGLVLLTLIIASDLVSRNSAAAARSANTIEMLATGLAAVRRDLEGARFIRIGANPKDAVLFSGAAQSVALAVADDGTGAHEGEGLVLIETRASEGRNALVRSSAALIPGTKGFGGAKFANDAVLLSGPWTYRFSYNDPLAGTDGWSGAWTATDHMPAAIRLEVLNDSGGQALPPLVVRLRIDSGGCAEPARVDCPESAETEQTPDPNDNQTNDQNKNPSRQGDGTQQ